MEGSKKGKLATLERETSLLVQMDKRAKNEAIKYYFDHGERILITCRRLGFLTPSILKVWIKKDKRWKAEHKAHMKATFLRKEEKRAGDCQLSNKGLLVK